MKQRQWIDTDMISHYFQNGKKLGSVDQIPGQDCEAIIFSPAGRQHQKVSSLKEGKGVVEAFWQEWEKTLN